jgi:hypothetical protein
MTPLQTLRAVGSRGRPGKACHAIRCASSVVRGTEGPDLSLAPVKWLAPLMLLVAGSPAPSKPPQQCGSLSVCLGPECSFQQWALAVSYVCNDPSKRWRLGACADYMVVSTDPQRASDAGSGYYFDGATGRVVAVWARDYTGRYNCVRGRKFDVLPTCWPMACPPLRQTCGPMPSTCEPSEPGK